MDGLYERDALAWAEQQAALLQRLAVGERVNEAIDWANVIEEVGDVGRAELHTVESLLEQAMADLVKIHLRPESEARNHWTAEVIAFLNNAQRRYGASMRQRIDLDGLYRQSVREALAAIGEPTWCAPGRCPFSFGTLLAADVDALRGELVSADPHP